MAQTQRGEVYFRTLHHDIMTTLIITMQEDLKDKDTLRKKDQPLTSTCIDIIRLVFCDIVAKLEATSDNRKATGG